MLAMIASAIMVVFSVWVMIGFARRNETPWVAIWAVGSILWMVSLVLEIGRMIAEGQ